MNIQVGGEDYTGYLVIDSIVGDTSSGGVRIYEDLAIQEIRDLAREMSFKYALFRLPRGGAKAGVKLSSALDREKRMRALQDFGAKIGPLVRMGIYHPGMDMNCGPEELRAIYSGAGITLGQVTDTSWFTALSVYHALEACADALNISGRQVTLAIEGFGSVARHLARRLTDRYRIVGVATLSAAVLDVQGRQAVELAELSDRHGDDFVKHLAGTTVDGDTLRTADVDVFIPAARTRTLTRELVARLRARAVLPIANAPYEEGAVNSLHARGVICLPGYVVNVGGVLASSLFDHGLGRSEIEVLFASSYRRFVKQLLQTAREGGISASQLAGTLAEGEIAVRVPHVHRSLPQRVYQRFIHRRLPRRVRATLARRRFARALEGLHEQTLRAGRAER